MMSTETAVHKQLTRMSENFKSDLDFIKEVTRKDTPLGRLAKYLLITERNPYAIFNKGYNQEQAHSFTNLINSLHHSLYDDGNITFYTINGKPKISLDYYPKREDLLGAQMAELEKTIGIKYELVYLTNDIDAWITLSEQFHENDIKKCFIDNYHRNKSSIDEYRKYSCFKEEWVREAEQLKKKEREIKIINAIEDKYFTIKKFYDMNDVEMVIICSNMEECKLCKFYIADKDKNKMICEIDPTTIEVVDESRAFCEYLQDILDKQNQ